MTLRVVSSPATCRPPLGDLLEQQADVLSRAQAMAYGLSAAAIRAHLAASRWQRVHRGIYCTYTGPLTRSSRQWAALLYCGEGATLGYETAGALYGLVGEPSDRVHVVVDARRRVRSTPGVVVHYSSRLSRTRHPAHSPPRTRVEDTVLDLVGSAGSLDRVLGLVATAVGRRLTTADRLRGALRHRPELRWRRELAVVLADVASGAHSALELLHLRRVERAHGLPVGERQRRVHRAGRSQWSDVVYRMPLGVVVSELDGRLGHDEPSERWRDYARDNAGLAEGEVTLRYGWADVLGRSCEVAAQEAQVLRRFGWAGVLRRCGPSCRALPLA